MSTRPDEIRRQYANFWKEKEWARYVSGCLLSDLQDVRRSRDILSWIKQNVNDWSASELQDVYLKLLRINHEIIEESLERGNSPLTSTSITAKEVIQECIWTLKQQWISLAFNICSTSETRNDYVFSHPDGMFAFWKLSFERRNKLIFLPGIQVEVTPFLHTLFVWKEYVEHMKEIEQSIRQYDIGLLFEGTLEVDYDSNMEEEERLPVLPIIKTEKKPATKKTTRKKSKYARNFEELVKQADNLKKPLALTVPNKYRSRSSSLHPKSNHSPSRRASHSPKVHKKPDVQDVKKEYHGEHLVDFTNEAYLGPVYHISIFETGKKPRQYGAWLMHTETDLNEYHMDGKSLNISLKVPVEDVFIAPSEPIIAFCENGSNEWKKGVFTTHTQFDQNSFVLSARLSKLGKVALFQATDFHFPYRKWSIEFKESSIMFKLHTHFVELSFIIEDNSLYLDSQTGDEFSKLRSLYNRKLSLPEMARQLIRHGVYLFPGSEILVKNRDTVKLLELELYVYRIICKEQLSCQSCRLNGSVAKDAVLVTHSNSQLHFFRRSNSNCSVSLPADRPKKINTSQSALSTLCRWLVITRPVSLTK